MSAPSLAAAVARAREKLVHAGLSAEEAARDAALLARFALDWTAAEWLVRRDERAPAGFADRLASLVSRRAAREPIAYLTGEREFYGRRFAVTRDVLIPRPETELVVEQALRGLARPPAPESGGRPLVADVGTGSGCLAVTLALECPLARVLATDVSAAALEVAKANAERLGALGRVEFRHGAYLGGAMGPFDLIVANLPYVPESDRASLPREVIGYEPEGALFGGADGLDVVRQLVPLAARSLASAGWLVFEIGRGQEARVRSLIGGSALAIDHVTPDLQGIPRVVVAKRRT